MFAAQSDSTGDQKETRKTLCVCFKFHPLISIVVHWCLVFVLFETTGDALWLFFLFLSSFSSSVSVGVGGRVTTVEYR